MRNCLAFFAVSRVLKNQHGRPARLERVKSEVIALQDERMLDFWPAVVKALEFLKK